MGGDKYPESPVIGALMALQEFPEVFIKLLGDLSVIELEMAKKTILLRYRKFYSRIIKIEAPQIVPMDIKNPTDVLQMPHSSIFVGAGLQRLQQADAFVSAGNTGAVMVAALSRAGRIPGIKRPALAIIMPTKNGPCICLDVGANAENDVMQLIQFAIMGSIYAQKAQGISRPRVGLMSVGEEASKGHIKIKLTNEKLTLLHDRNVINFIGNVQGNDVLAGTADVIVMDGFVGNVVLKMAEEFIPTLRDALKKKLHESNPLRKIIAALSFALLKPTIASIKYDFDYQKYGGAPFLGVNGVIIKAHGKSTPLAIKNAIGVARKAAQGQMVIKIREVIEKFPPDVLQLQPGSK